MNEATRKYPLNNPGAKPVDNPVVGQRVIAVINKHSLLGLYQPIPCQIIKVSPKSVRVLVYVVGDIEETVRRDAIFTRDDDDWCQGKDNDPYFYRYERGIDSQIIGTACLNRTPYEKEMGFTGENSPTNIIELIKQSWAANPSDFKPRA